MRRKGKVSDDNRILVKRDQSLQVHWSVYWGSMGTFTAYYPKPCWDNDIPPPSDKTGHSLSLISTTCQTLETILAPFPICHFRSLTPSDGLDHTPLLLGSCQPTSVEAKNIQNISTANNSHSPSSAPQQLVNYHLPNTKYLDPRN